MSRNCLKLSLVVCFLALAAVQAGAYDFNVDFVNNVGYAVTDLHFTLEGEVTVDHYYTGSLNPFGDGIATHMKDGKHAPPNDHTWIEFRGATIEKHQLIHVGFNTGGKVRVSKAKGLEEGYHAFWTLNRIRLLDFPVPLPGCWYEYDYDNDRVAVFVNNDAGPENITIYNLSYHLPASRMPLNDLMWDSISWSPIPGTVDLAPNAVGGPFYIDNVSEDDFVVFGWETIWTGDTSATGNVCRPIFQEQAFRSVSKSSQWWLIIFCFLLLGMVVLVIVRRKKATVTI